MLPLNRSPRDDGAQKRPCPSDSASDKAAKRRASRACLSCRNRKVRCDVVNGGVPCTNCRLDGVKCVVKESNRGRRPTATNTPPPVTPPTAQHRLPSPSPQPPLPPPPAPSLPKQVTPPHDYLVSLSFEDQSPDVQNHPQNEPHVPVPSIASLDQASSVGDAPQRLPPYIRRLPDHVTRRDLEYLEEKDALTIPDSDLCDELLRTYVNVVHPFMPVLDLENFLGPIIRGDGRDPVSLLLFQAVMFASVTFVDIKLLQTRNYGSRKEVRKIFFNRVRLLYGLDCEPDRLALIQALLLMTYWYDTPDNFKDTWYWMGIALSLAQVVGLHRDPDSLGITGRENHLRRRMWWSCVMRDRLLALGIRRPARIRDGDFDVSRLTLDDFDLGSPSPTLLSLMGDCSIMGPDAEARTAMAVMCIELSQLCVCLGHILHSQYTVLGENPVISEYFLKVIVQPRRSETQMLELVKCDAELTEWLRSQDARSRYAPGLLGPEESGDGSERIIRLHQALLRMIYLTAQGALHRPQVFYSASDPSVRKVSREKVTEAAIAMTKLAFDLQANNQLRYLSTSSIPAFLSATLIHLLEIRSPDEEVRNLSIGRFYQCVQALNQLQDMYTSADYAIRFLETVLRSTDVQIPMLTLGCSPDFVQKSIPDFGSPNRIATTHPNQLGYTNRSLRETPVRNHESLQVDMSQSLSPLMDSFDSWPSVNNHFGNNQPSTEMTPYASMWSDVDSLLPALVNFNADPAMLMSNSDTAPSTCWTLGS